MQFSKAMSWVVVGFALLLCSALVVDAGGVKDPIVFDGMNLDADMIIFDVGSLTPDHGIDNFDRCVEACKNVAGCNGVVWCGHSGGCGNKKRCDPSKYQKMAPSPNDYREQYLPITKPGSYAPASACTSEGRFRYKLCSLKKIKNLKPKFHDDSSRGWKSAMLDMGPGRRMGACKGNKPMAMCDFCDSTFDELHGSRAWSQCWQCLDTMDKSLGDRFTLWQAMRPFRCMHCFVKELRDENVDRSRCFKFVTGHVAKGLPEFGIPFS